MAERTSERAVNGVTLFERRTGEGPPVVILHGGPGASHDYLLPGCDALAAAPQRRGGWNTGWLTPSETASTSAKTGPAVVVARTASRRDGCAAASVGNTFAHAPVEHSGGQV